MFKTLQAADLRRSGPGNQNAACGREPDAANYWALVVGINQYREWPVLQTAVNDPRSS